MVSLRDPLVCFKLRFLEGFCVKRSCIRIPLRVLFCGSLEVSDVLWLSLQATARSSSGAYRSHE